MLQPHQVLANADLESDAHREILSKIINATNSDENLVFIDLFCGAGGMSEGLARSLEEIASMLDCEINDFAELHAVNHDEECVRSHRANHDWARHYNKPIDDVDPWDVVDIDREVLLLLAAPDCTQFSSAKGGRPKDPDKRMLPREVLTWVETLSVQNLLVENVPDLRKWSPLDSDKKPIPGKEGEHFDHWIEGFAIEGFNIEHRVLCCADYGDATTRRRLFICGRKENGISWPEPTHSEDGTGDTDEWRTAADILDWSDPGGSLWVRDLRDGRKSPLKSSTMKRIAEGLRKHNPALEPFAGVIEKMGKRDEDEPVEYPLKDLRETVVPAEYAHEVAESIDRPFLVDYRGTPVLSLGAGDRQSILLRQNNGDGAYPLDVDEDPVPTIAKAGSVQWADASSFVLPKNGRHGGLHSNSPYKPDDRPAHTITANDIRQGYDVRPVLTQYSHSGRLLSADDPLPTITTADSRRPECEY
jgi:DNA (cytosine-5)-methyltransferase 1